PAWGTRYDTRPPPTKFPLVPTDLRGPPCGPLVVPATRSCRQQSPAGGSGPDAPEDLVAEAADPHVAEALAHDERRRACLQLDRVRHRVRLRVDDRDRGVGLIRDPDRAVGSDVAVLRQLPDLDRRDDGPRRRVDPPDLW